MADRSEHPMLPALKAELAERRLDRREFLRTATLLGMGAGAAYAFADHVLGAAPARAQAPQAMPRGGTLRVGGLVMEIRTPHAITSQQLQANLIRPVLEHLTQLGHDNITRPMLAEGWEPSADLRSWTVRLRRDVKWHKGRDFTAEDVVWNLNRVLDVATGSPALGLFAGFLLEITTEGGQRRSRLWAPNAIEIVDRHTVRFNGKAPLLALPEYLAHYAVWMMDPQEGGTFGPGSNGTGAFELRSHQVNSRAVYAARREYWGQPAHLESYEFIHLGEGAQAPLSALASRQVDGLIEVSPDQIEPFRALPNITLYDCPTATAVLVAGKTNVAPWNDARVRRALRLATDQQAVIDAALRGYGTVGEHHHVAAIHPEYAPLPPFRRDVARARALLAEAGHPNGIDVELLVQESPSFAPLAAQTMVEQWKDAGIRVRLKVVPRALYGDLWRRDPFIFTSWDHRPLGIMMYGLAYRSGVNDNHSEYANPELDRLILEAEGIVDVPRRRAVMERIQRLMQEDGPITQPMFRSIVTAYSNRVLGFRMHPQFAVWPNLLAVRG